MPKRSRKTGHLVWVGVGDAPPPVLVLAVLDGPENGANEVGPPAMVFPDQLAPGQALM